MLDKKLTLENFELFKKWSKKTLTEIEDVVLGVSHVIQHLGFEAGLEFRSLWSGMRFDVANRELCLQYALAGCPDVETWITNGKLKTLGRSLLIYDAHNTLPDQVYIYFMKHLTTAQYYRYASRGAEQAEQVKQHVNVNHPIFQTLYFQEEDLENKIKRIIPTILRFNIQDSQFFDFISLAKENPTLTYSLFTKEHIETLLNKCNNKSSIDIINSNMGKLIRSLLQQRPDLCDVYYEHLIQNNFSLSYALCDHPKGLEFIKNAEYNVFNFEDYKVLISIWKENIQYIKHQTLRAPWVPVPDKELFLLLDKCRQYDITSSVQKHVRLDMPNLFILHLLFNPQSIAKLRETCKEPVVLNGLDFIEQGRANGTFDAILKKAKSAMGVKRTKKLQEMDPVGFLLSEEALFLAAFEQLAKLRTDHERYRSRYGKNSLTYEEICSSNNTQYIDIYHNFKLPTKVDVEEMELLF